MGGVKAFMKLIATNVISNINATLDSRGIFLIHEDNLKCRNSYFIFEQIVLISERKTKGNIII